MIKVLFVCLGNICRSPMAEGIFLNKLKERGLTDRVLCDSAGTSAYHIGERPDDRACMTCSKNNIELNHRARQLVEQDFSEFQYILAMDSSNYTNIQKLCKDGMSGCEIRKMREFDDVKDSIDVPDPYYGGISGFDRVFEMLDRSCERFLDYLVEKHQL